MADHSRARFFFDEIIEKKENAFAFLASLVDGGDAAAENGWRDYKEAGFLGKTGNADQEKEKIKSIWSEYLSAFANTGGGVLIWGFHTKGKIPDKLSLALDCEQLADLLRSLANDATEPYVAGVEIRAIKNLTDAKGGIVICYIPASTFAPHQAQWGERTYFIRTQDSNLPCPQPLLRSMFYPRAQSRLEPIIKMTVQTLRGGAIEVSLEVSIMSLGPATAEVAIISVEELNLGQPHIDYDTAWEKIGANFVRYTFPLPPNFIAPQPIRIQGVLLSNGAKVVFRFFTHNAPAHHSTVSFTQQEILQYLSNKGTLERRGRCDPIFP
jgi:hypothetical protein